ncbi:MAG: helix-turn-helix domain-containing protein [Firmicutes bacterium]|nr:helix-turn-helix domain-containing protein [Bacillota bacterium]MCM1393909.1 helix-turn-helix domain-containing protein [[Eubacterium] siraeum]
MDTQNNSKLSIEELLIKGGALIDKIIANKTLNDDERLEFHTTLYDLFIKSIVKKWIDELPMQQKDLANKLGVSKQAITEYKKGRAIPPTSTFFMLAEIAQPEYVERLLGTTVDEIEKLLSNNKAEDALNKLARIIKGN